MKDNPLKVLRSYGQSIWLDNIRRDLITSGGLKKMIDEDGIRGVTSNPTIFEKAISGSDDYDDPLLRLHSEGKTVPEILDGLMIQDIQMAADVFKSLYDQTEGEDGYISLEVSPLLSHKEDETVQAVLDIYKRVDRRNVMIKVPATQEGIRAHEQLTGMGISINMTLIFSQGCYEAVARAYIDGLKRLDDNGQPMGFVRSVASVFVSRVDTQADKSIEEKIRESPGSATLADIKSLTGKVAIANAKMIYQKFKALFSDPPFLALKKRGAHVQRPLWGSTGTKNPNYSDVLYVEELIGHDTVNTAPPATIDAFRDHGIPRSSIEEKVDDAKATLEQLDRVGIDLAAITDQLQVAGVKSFSESYRNLINVITEKKERLLEKHKMHYS